jgi:CRP/FNR family transcriptional regulator, nitrogen fixation regulation protein
LPDGRRQIGTFHLPGDIFGVENRLVHRFTAEAIAETTVWVTERRHILGGDQDTLHPPMDVAKLLARSLEHAENHLLLLGRHTSIEKVAAFLMEMDRRLRSPSVLILPMNRRDIADYLGLTVETVSRELTALKRAGVLNFEGRPTNCVAPAS